MKRWFCVLLVLVTPALAWAQKSSVDVVVAESHGVPTFLTGDLGYVDPMPAKNLASDQDETLAQLSAKALLEDLVVTRFGASGAEELRPVRVRHDRHGTVHVRFEQYLDGLRVVGAELIVHSEADSGKVYAVNGRFVPDAQVQARGRRSVDTDDLLARLAKRGLRGEAEGEPEAVYFHDTDTGFTHLSWLVRLHGIDNQGMFFDSDVYVDAHTFDVVAVDAHVHTAKVRNTHDATGSVVGSTSISGLPGTLVCNETTTNCNDASAQRAHDGAGDVYDYYQTRFGRDSLNDSGMTMRSSVHVGSNWPNAAWYNNQMIYGDGDGSQLDDLTKSFDVIAHELTHGVTDFESNLIYQKESGALNEALSDIFGVAADSYSRGGVIDAATWKLGEEVYTPNTAGDALRYMNDPDADGYSKGYYPERLYAGSCTPSGSNDQCGVHGNSGIANLAFYLMVEGGTHPRGKTTVNVPAIGMAKAEQIFYRAQTTYLTSSSNFEAARTATTQAAADLYGQTEVDAVHDAWCAVGVPGCPPSGGGGGGSLANGVAETGLSGSQGSQTFFTLDVPAGASDLSVQLSGGSGDADLYVKAGSQPSTSSYDCRSWNSGNSESCSFASPSTGTYHVLVHAYSAFSGASLVATWTEPSGGGGGGGGGLSNGSAETNLSGGTGSETFFTVAIPAGASDLTITTSGGSGDVDLYVRFGSQPTTSTYDCRPYQGGNNETCTFATPSAGTYHVMLRGYSAYSGVSLLASWTEPSGGGGGSCGNTGSVTDVSGAANSETRYTFEVDACASSVTIEISGGTGDADLYVRFGSQPTTSTYDCRPYQSGNNEVCTFDPPSTGTYHIMLRGYSAYSGVDLEASYQ